MTGGIKLLGDCFESRKLKILILIFIIGIYIAGSIYSYSFTVDDSYISLRYAENLVKHGQLSFNPGEQPNEGYSNFLLVIIEALFIKFGIQNPVEVPKIIGIISGVLTITFVYKISEILIDFTNPWVKYLPATAIAFSSPFIIWSVGGLETVLFTSLIVMGMYFSIRSFKANNFFCFLMWDFSFCLAALTRPEGLLFWVLSYIYLAIKYREINIKLRLKSVLFFLIVISSYLIWKYFYFGSVIPLTFYVKTGKVFTISTIGDGLARFSYLLKINLNFIYFLFFIAAIIVSFLKRCQLVNYIASISIVYAVYIFSLGYAVAMDDTFRLYVPFLPWFYIVAAVGIGYAGERVRPNISKIFTVLLALLITAQLIIGYNDLNVCWNKDHNFGSKPNAVISLKNYQNGWDDFKYFGIWLRNNIPNNSIVVIPDIGAVSYFSKLKIIDSWSLVTKEIVLLRNQQLKYPNKSPECEEYNKKISNYILDQDPDVIVIQYYELYRYEYDPRIHNYNVFEISLPSGRNAIVAVKPELQKYFNQLIN